MSPRPLTRTASDPCETPSPAWNDGREAPAPVRRGGAGAKRPPFVLRVLNFQVREGIFSSS